MTSNLSPSTQTQVESRIDPMEWLFARLHGKYGKRFTEQYGSGVMVKDRETGKERDTGIENTKSVWREDLRNAGVRSLGDLKRGLARCGTFVPSGPEFLAFCCPALDVDAAIVEAVAQLQARRDGKDVWSHPAVYWAAIKVGYHEMTNLSHAQLKPRFSAALDAVRAEEIKPVPAIVVAPRIEMAPVSQADIAKAKAAISDYSREMLKGNGAPVDGLRWAKRILEREAHGQSVSLLQLKEAQQAITAGSYA